MAHGEKWTLEVYIVQYYHTHARNRCIAYLTEHVHQVVLVKDVVGNEKHDRNWKDERHDHRIHLNSVQHTLIILLTEHINVNAPKYLHNINANH